MVETDIGPYAEQVLPWAQRDPVRNSVLATQLVAHPGAAGAWLARLEQDGAVAGAAVRVTGRGLVLAALPPGAAAGLAALAPPGLPEVSGPDATAAEFAAAYGRRTGAAGRPRHAHRLYALGELVRPDVPGELRTVTDPEPAALWDDAFARSVGLTPDPDGHAVTARVVAEGRLFHWVVGGEPVAMAGHSPTVAGTTRIGPVWTPPEHRRHGYAAAATAALAARLPGTVILLADDGNPTAVGVYTRLGFRPVGVWGDWSLEY